jgi:hypothetical protein
VLSHSMNTASGTVQGGIGTIHPGLPTGQLPMWADMTGLRGHRDGLPDSVRWIWTIESAVLVAKGEPVVFRVWLTLPVRDQAPTNLRADDDVINLTLHGEVHRDFHFLQDLRFQPDEVKRDPVAAVSGPAELVLAEVGTTRELRIPFKLPAGARRNGQSDLA